MVLKWQKASQNLRGMSLYMKLIDHIEDNLGEILKQVKTSPSEDPLVFYTREWDKFMDSSTLLSKVLAYLDRVYIKGTIEDGGIQDYGGHFALYDIRTLHIIQRDSILVPGVRKRIHFAAWKAAVTGSGGEIIRHPAVEQIINLSSIRRPLPLPSNLRLRRLVLLTRPVDRLRRMMNKVGNPGRGSLVTLSHWALLIEDEPYKGTLHEIRVLKGASRRQTRRYSQTDGWARQVVGDTLLNNSNIQEYGLPLSNNCQRFCIDLFHSIRIPCNENDILKGVERYPYEFSAMIRSRRCQEFEWLSYDRYRGNLAPVPSIPTPIETYTVLALNTAPIIFIRWVEISAWRLVYMIFLVGLYALYAKPSGVGFRLISRRKEDPFKSIYREVTRQRHLRKLGSSSSTVSAFQISKGRRKVTMPVTSRKRGTPVGPISTPR
ncbi:hypothetical protein COCMIDRAFT_27069 [Bipolaris oryzae ATCC 44560]|uniref:Cullin N-terminal domain-containing protein n=1 Tax=Bipolaris oryzae ATCC 44560 TaxID=930090 RepID=W6Z3V6_COCMI|nr:uncharacterized protein COCMIDRAFT_27069 [Bipolaris oryzae ATCC 44560]EUC44640.1 hypothetical protein COCMIDRAFT_27069 [Bipolaris oryzae ATCC 44560]